MQSASRLCVSTSSSTGNPEILFSGAGLTFAIVIQQEPEVSHFFEAAVHNGYGAAPSAVQTLGLQEGWEESSPQRSELQSLVDQLSPPSQTLSL